MPYSGTTVFAKALASAVNAITLNARAEGIQEIRRIKPECAAGILKHKWDPRSELLDESLIGHWKTLAEESGKNYVVEKSPSLMVHRSRLKEMLPESIEFLLVRNPVQQYLSQRKRQVINGVRLRTKELQLENTSQQWTESWFRKYYERLRILTHIAEDGVEVVSYEQFLNDPGNTLRSLSGLGDIDTSGLTGTVVVKGSEPEEIKSRDKIPSEWLSKWESSYIRDSLKNHREMLQKLSVVTHL